MSMNTYSLKTEPYGMREVLIVRLSPAPSARVIDQVCRYLSHSPTETVIVRGSTFISLRFFYDKARPERKRPLLLLALHRSGWLRCDEAFIDRLDADACFGCDALESTTDFELPVEGNSMPLFKLSNPKTRIAVTLTYDQWTSLLRGLHRLESLKPEADENHACFAMDVGHIKSSRGILTEALAQKIAARRRK